MFEQVLPEFDHYLAIYNFFNSVIAISTSKALGSGTRGPPNRILRTRHTVLMKVPPNIRKPVEAPCRGDKGHT
jgi:hypothetical protein